MSTSAASFSSTSSYASLGVTSGFAAEPSVTSREELKTMIGNLGFFSQEMLSFEENLETAAKIIKIFQAVYPGKKLTGTLFEQCEEASKHFKDLPSKLYINDLFPMRAPDEEIPQKHNTKIR